MKKIVLSVCCLIILGVLLFSCKKQDNRIVIYSCAEDYRNEFYLNGLKEKFPQYNFSLDYMSSGSSAAKLKAEGRKSQGDILLSWEYGYLEMNKDVLADMSYFDDSIYLDDMKVSSRRWVGEYRNSGCIVLYPKVLEERGLAKPESYADLLKPEYKGMISMPNPKTSGTGYMFLKNLVNVMGEETAFEYFDKLAENILQFTSSGSGPINAMIQGEVAIALGMTGQAVTAINNGVPLEITFFAEGAPCSFYGHAITAKGETRAEVKEVFDYLVKEVTPACDAAFFPEQVFVDKVFLVPNYPKNIPYGDMSGDTSTEKIRLLRKWKY